MNEPFSPANKSCRGGDLRQALPSVCAMNPTRARARASARLVTALDPDWSGAARATRALGAGWRKEA